MRLPQKITDGHYFMICKLSTICGPLIVKSSVHLWPTLQPLALRGNRAFTVSPTTSSKHCTATVGPFAGMKVAKLLILRGYIERVLKWV